MEEKNLVSALEVLLKFVLLLNSVLLFLCFFHCSSSQMHCAFLFYFNLFIHYHLLLLAGMGIVHEMQISVAVKLTFCGEKYCPWGKEIGGTKKDEIKEALVLVLH